MQIEIHDDDVDTTLSALASALIALAGQPRSAEQIEKLYFTIRNAK